MNNENCGKFIYSKVYTFYTQISCIENTFDIKNKIIYISIN